MDLIKNYNKLLNIILTTFEDDLEGEVELKLYYYDEDNMKIMISSDEDLEEAIE